MSKEEILVGRLRMEATHVVGEFRSPLREVVGASGEAGQERRHAVR
jgi:hypothetical protein